MDNEGNPDEVSVAPRPSYRWLTTPPVMLECATVFTLACATLFTFAYAVREQHLAGQRAADAARLTAENKQLSASLSQMQSEVNALEAKLNAMSTPVSQPPSPPPEPAEANRAPVRKAAGPRKGESHQFTKIENQLAEQQKAIANTQQNLEEARKELEGNLSSARNELNGSIARTHDELVALAKKGERNYYEFDLVKSKQFEQVGPLGLSLRKPNTKHRYYDMAMVVDDRQLNKKQVNLYEPLLIYPADSHQPLEIVVNRITRDGVHGYVSTPKYTEAQIAALGAATSAASTPVENSSPTQPTLSQRPTQP